MKYKFLIDENIIFYAARLEDEHGNRIPETSEFISMVWKNCHSMVADSELNRRFIKHLKEIKASRNRYQLLHEGMTTITQLFKHSEKCIRDWEDLKPIPNESIYPHEDIHVVRAAAHFKVNLVSIDAELRNAINNSPFFQSLGVRALSPKEALPLANET